MRFSAIHPSTGQIRRPAALRRWVERAALFLVSGLAIAISGGEILRAADPGAPADNGMANVLAIRRDPTRTEPVSAELRGVVIYVRSPSLFCLQSKDAGVLVSLPDRTPLPKLGEQLWVEVGVKFQDESSEAPLPAHAVRNEGPVGLPEPTHPWLLGALNGDTDGRWIEVEGYVMQARLERDLLLLHMTDKSGWAIASIPGWKGVGSVSNLWGALVRIRAANIGHGHLAIRVPSPDHVTVLKPGTPELFAGAMTSISGLRASSSASAERLHVGAVIHKLDQDTVYLRSEGFAFRASYLRPFPAASTDPDRLELIPGPIPVLRTGDHVELVGSVLESSADLILSFSSFRVLGTNTPPLPRLIQGVSLARGTAINDLVRISGRLVSRESIAKGKLFLETLKLEADGFTFLAQLESGGGGALAALNVGDMLELVGLVIAGPKGGPHLLKLFSPSDAQTVWLAPSVARERVIRIVGIGLVLLLAAGGWIGFLRFKLAERERAAARMRAANDELEQRVRERTSQLEVAKEELRRNLDQERELGELKSRFVAMVSHEFRTPLGIIMSSAEILEAYLDRLPEVDRRANLQDIFQSTRHMAAMMEEVLVLGRVESGTVKFHPVALALAPLCRRLVDEVTSATGNRCPIRFTSPDAIPEACGDEALLRHILTNLLSNAVKYSNEGSPVELTLEIRAPLAAFSVVDRGIGIPEADQASLFQAFHRCRNVGDVPGTGLGMVIVKHCVELHGGSITFDSREGAGSTFRVALPLFHPLIS